MKTFTYVAAAALAVLAACSTRQPGNEPQPSRGGVRAYVAQDSATRALFSAYRAAQMPSVYGLIGARERLNLTSTQVNSLDSISEAVREENRPLTDSLRTITRSPNGGPILQPRTDMQREEMLPILRRIGENDRRAVSAVQQILTPAQRTSVCTLVAEQGYGRYADREDGRGRGGGIGGGVRGGYGGRGMGTMDDSTGIRRGGFGAGGWPWCTGGMRGRGMSRDSARTDTAHVRRP